MRSARAVPLSHSLFLVAALPVLSVALRVSRSFSRCHTVSLPLPLVRALSTKKKRRGLRSIFITQTGRPSGAHKKCLFTYGDWSATGFGGNAEPLSRSLPLSRYAPHRWRLFPTRVLRFSACPPRALSCAPLSLSPFPPFFFRRGEKMRAARRLVEGTDDVVSDVPPPGLGGGDARETVVRGRAVECERRHRRVHISRGCCMRGRERRGKGANLRSNWKYYYTKRIFAESPRAHRGKSAGNSRASGAVSIFRCIKKPNVRSRSIYGLSSI